MEYALNLHCSMPLGFSTCYWRHWCRQLESSFVGTAPTSKGRVPYNMQFIIQWARTGEAYATFAASASYNAICAPILAGVSDGNWQSWIRLDRAHPPLRFECRSTSLAHSTGDLSGFAGSRHKPLELQSVSSIPTKQIIFARPARLFWLCLHNLLCRGECFTSRDFQPEEVVWTSFDDAW